MKGELADKMISSCSGGLRKIVPSSIDNVEEVRPMLKTLPKHLFQELNGIRF